MARIDADGRIGHTTLADVQSWPLREYLASADHWLDGLEAGVRTHIQQLIRRRDELVAQATPPAALFDSVAGDPDLVAQGAKLNQVYARALKQAASAQGVDAEGRLEAPRQAVEAHLSQYRPRSLGAPLNRNHPMAGTKGR